MLPKEASINDLDSLIYYRHMLIDKKIDMLHKEASMSEDFRHLGATTTYR